MSAALALDRALTLWINQHHNVVLDALLLTVSYLGDAGIAWILAAVLMLIFGSQRTRLLAVIFMAGLALTELGLMPWLREAWPRPRPFVAMAGIRTLGHRWDMPSFPSAHAHLWGQATLLFGMAYRRWRWPLIVLLVLSLYARPYVGMHYVIDTLAGLILGLSIGGLELLVAGKLGLIAADAEDERVVASAAEQGRDSDPMC